MKKKKKENKFDLIVGRIFKSKIVQIFSVIAVCLSIFGVFDIVERIDYYINPIIVIPSIIPIAPDYTQKTICFIENRSRTTQDVQIAIFPQNCVNHTKNLVIDIEYDKFSSVKLGSSTGYIEASPVMKLWVKGAKNSEQESGLFLLFPDIPPKSLQQPSQRFSIQNTYPSKDCTENRMPYIELKVIKN